MKEPRENRPEKDAPGDPFYLLRLFVAGGDPNSEKAKAVLYRLCESYLPGHYEIQIIDVYKDYQKAIEYRVIVVPTLIIETPPPVRTIVGSLSDEEKVLAALGFAEQKRPS